MSSSGQTSTTDGSAQEHTFFLVFEMKNSNTPLLLSIDNLESEAKAEEWKRDFLRAMKNDPRYAKLPIRRAYVATCEKDDMIPKTPDGAASWWLDFVQRNTDAQDPETDDVSERKVEVLVIIKV